ncbi:SsgA family sporulation/cell division regulator [Streptomyces lomondensis]|uniref:Uncharacterized protein n=1 Tax=Streptomyces lomondensis TaxID=68229 RepID=A0ABQ2XQX1_9ACTN|nr:SsgA family sporulation/cell division regulator [Streptomyces lomondensis]MCF0082170.1 SsgA family sporulation/cell division regulator [Streptomyces lomondensis]GGX27825.1 hypothetical protein GCM10010383_68140 [Streptomyces lomondensis]
MQLPLEKTINAILRTAECEGCEVALCVRCSVDDPLAIRMEIRIAEQEAPVAIWVFSRDLLATGLILPSGEGDVHVRPHGEDETDIELVSREAWCVIRAASIDLRDIVARTHSAEESCREEIDTALDRMLEEILSGGLRKADSQMER